MVLGSSRHDKLFDPSDNLVGVDLGVDFAGRGPIDVVYTWVNGSDPRQQAALAALLARLREAKLAEDRLCAPFSAAQLADRSNASVPDVCRDRPTTTAAPTTKQTTTAAPTTEPVPEWAKIGFNARDAPSHDGESTTSPAADESDAAASSRFVDNEELRYSLRSVIKYAPWVRHIYIVTNGQVPYWLDTMHPRITVVQHSEIFLNSSHLPTFSSPAIEVHLHRIPGLASRFIYLNDDVMFGAPVLPSDFWTIDHGQRIYLAWPVPDCAAGCPSNWIGDGFCDISCNVADCGFDYPDCVNQTAGGGGGGGGGGGWWNANNANRWSSFSTSNRPSCVAGCPDGWIGDKYCDAQCNVKECAYDGGDCAIADIYNNVAGFVLTLEDDVYVMPRGTTEAYFNMSGVLGASRITEGTHDQPDVVRTATMSQEHKVLTLTFFPNSSDANVSVIVVAQGTDLKMTEYLFNITVNNAPPSKSNDTAAAEPSEAPAHDDDADLAAVVDDGVYDDYGAQRRILSLVDLIEDDDGDDEADVEAPPLPANRLSQMAAQAADAFHRRKLLDTFGDSLKYVNQLYNRHFQTTSRRVPAHMPHFIDRHIEEELQAVFPAEFEATSSHQLRSSTDMQYSFAYMYYVAHARSNVTLDSVWHEYIDTDLDDALSWNELRTLAALVYGTPLKYNDVDRLFRVLAHCEPRSTTTTTTTTTASTTATTTAATAASADTTTTAAAARPAADFVRDDADALFDRVWPDVLQKHVKNVSSPSAPDEAKARNATREAYSAARSERLKEVRGGEGLHTSGDDAYADSRLDRKKRSDSSRPAWEYDGGGGHVRDWAWSFGTKDGGAVPSLDNATKAVRALASAAGRAAADSEYASEVAAWAGGEPLARVRVARVSLEACPRVLDKLLEHFSERPKYKHEEIVESPEVAFLMISTNQTNLEEKLDGVRVRRHKFICLNDNMNHADKHNHDSIHKLQEFYRSLYPLPSPFELPADKPNAVLYIDELSAELRQVRYDRMLVVLGGLVLCGVLCCVWLASRRGAVRNRQRQRREDDNKAFLRI
jgi:hypothetical protein